MKNIVELQHDSQGLALEEALRYLGVPDEFVGVHRRLVIASTTLHVEVGGKGCTPRGCDSQHTAIGELPGIEVVIRLEIVA